MSSRAVKTTEHNEQHWFFDACAVRANFDRRYALPFAVPNAGKRSIGALLYYKAEGLKPGVPDICVPVPVGGFHGAFIEMKVGSNKPSDNQRWWLSELQKQGFAVTVKYSGADAFEWIEQYFAGALA